MTFPAARKLDTNTHDMLVPAGTIGPPVAGPCPGFGPVMIENQPAAHAGCAVICAGTLSAGVAHPPPPVPPLIVMGAGTVFIHGKPAARWAPAPDISACGSFLGNPALAASRTVFIGEVSSLTVAITNLGAMLAARIEQLDRGGVAADAHFEKWFGSKDAAAKAVIRERMVKMQALLNSYADSNFKGAGADNENELFAYVYGNDDKAVYLGNAFANSPATGENSQAGVLGHEMSHFDSVGATDDVENADGDTVYGVDLSKQLAIDDPNLALTNADNFEFYLEGAP